MQQSIKILFSLMSTASERRYAAGQRLVVRRDGAWRDGAWRDAEVAAGGGR